MPTASRTSSRSSRSTDRARWTTFPLYSPARSAASHRIPASAARADPERDLRRHHLSGAGAADRQGCSPAIRSREADLLRRAMGKKIKSEMDAQKERFLKGADGARRSSLTAPTISSSLVAKFAEYGFNKSHSAPYAYHRLSNRLSQGQPSGRIPRRVDVARHRQHRQAADVPPRGAAHGRHDRAALGQCQRHRFRGEGRCHPLFARGAEECRRRARSSIWSRCASEAGPSRRLAISRAASIAHVLNKRALESLVKAGAFDVLHPNRAQVFDGVEAILAMANRTSAETAAGQNDLFGGRPRAGKTSPSRSASRGCRWSGSPRSSRRSASISPAIRSMTI